MIRAIPLAGLLVLTAVPALANPTPSTAVAPAPEEGSIPFVNHGGVDDWRAVGDKVIYFKDSHGRWFKATLFSAAFDLPFVDEIGIETRGSDTLDKFGAIVVRGQRYPLQSLVKVDGPPKGKLRKPG